MRADHSTGNGSRSLRCIQGSSASGMRSESMSPTESTATWRETGCSPCLPWTVTVGA